MAITAFQVRTIFDTLPIGYYLGRNIKVELSETSSQSYYNAMGDNIVISEPCILATCNKNAIPANQVEEVVRGLVYHEVSHVILTGKNWIDKKRNKKVQEHFNIVEDERIETILKDYYMNTNFRRNIFRINQYHGQDPKNAEEAFYHFIRFHKAEDKWLKRLENFISQYKGLNAATTSWNSYITDIEQLYKDFTKDWKENSQNQSGDGESDESDEDQNNGQGSGSSNDLQNDQNESNGFSGSGNKDNNSGDQDSQMTPGNFKDILDELKDQGASEEEIAKAIEDAIDALADATKEFDIPDFSLPGRQKAILKRTLTAVFDQHTNTELVASLRKIIEVSKKKKGYFSGAYNAYSGRINPRDCGRDDYKWFVKDNRNSSQKRFSKIHFNLFIDHSGSFCGCNDAINELLKALNSIKAPDFDFDVITIDTEIVEWETPDQYEFDANGGTDLNNDIGPVIRRHQKTGCMNYNIVVFDGMAHDRCYRKDNEPFNHFDTNNTVLVVDESNRIFVDHLTSCKKTIIRGDYADTFIDEVLALLERVMA